MPVPAFTLAVVCGAAGWVILATLKRLPVSTTHVSAGAIAGIAGSDAGRLNRRTVRDLVLAWTVTPVVAGTISIATYLLAARLI